MKLLIQYDGEDALTPAIHQTRAQVLPLPLDPTQSRGEQFREGLTQALQQNADIWITVEPGCKLTAETLIQLLHILDDNRHQVASATIPTQKNRFGRWAIRRLLGPEASVIPGIRAFSTEAIQRLQLTGAGHPEMELAFRIHAEQLREQSIELGDTAPLQSPHFGWGTFFREFFAEHALGLTLGSAAIPLVLLVFVRPLPVNTTILLGCLSLVVGTTASATQFWVHWKRHMAPPWQRLDSQSTTT